MKQHILTALSEEFANWEERLASLSEAQIIAPDQPAALSIKDIVAHLWAWQQRSIARLHAALHNQEPAFPSWPVSLDAESVGSTDQINAWIYETYRDEPWPSVHQEWRAGFLQFLELAGALSEDDLLDSSKYAWLEDRPLALVLLGSYSHHHEHFEQLRV